MIAIVRAEAAPLHGVEWQAMRLDGHVVPTGPSSAGLLRRAERPLGRGERAAALRAHVPRGLVAAGGTAAWVLDGLAPGSRIRVAASARRRRVAARPDLDTSFHRLSPGEVVTIEGLALTAPARTLADLALEGAAPGRIAALVDALRSEPLDPADAPASGDGAARLAAVSHAALDGRWGAAGARERLAAAGLPRPRQPSMRCTS